MEKQKKIQLLITGMSCAGCEYKIEKRLAQINGVENCQANYQRGYVSIVYDGNEKTLGEITRTLRKMNYDIKQGSSKSKRAQEAVVIGLIMMSGLLVANHLGLLDFLLFIPDIEVTMGYGALFVIGLLTSVHCIGMCGGINLSQNLNVTGKTTQARLVASAYYNIGRILAYTVIGGLVGGIGSVMSVTPAIQGIIAMIASAFMIIMGLNMLQIFPSLRRFNLKIPRKLRQSVYRVKKVNHPFIIGMLNGMMPCGPLQAMQLYALSTGDPIQGALAMFVFALGTTPLMFSFGALSALMTKKFTQKMMTVSAVLIVILGIGMFQTGLGLAGISGLTSGQPQTVAQIENGVQYVDINVTSRSYEEVTLQAGVAAQLTFKVAAEDLNGCNQTIIIPAYGIEIKLQPGDNIIEFTPMEKGNIAYSCWMAMIRSTIHVI